MAVIVIVHISGMWEEDNVESSQFQVLGPSSVGQHHGETQPDNQSDWVPSFQTSFILKSISGFIKHVLNRISLQRSEQNVSYSEQLSFLR